MSQELPDLHDSRGPQERSTSSLGTQVVRSPASSRASLHRALNALPQILFIVDEKGGMEFINEAGLAYSGRPLDEILGDRWLTAIHPDDVETARKALERSVATAGALDLDVRVRRSDGAYRWFLARSSPMRGTDGQVTHWIGSLTDIHERKAGEAALQESERRFRQLVDAIPHAVWTAGPNGSSTFINRHWREYTGLSARQTREDYASVIHPADLPVLQARFAEGRARGNEVEVEYRVKRKADGAYRWHRGKGHPIRDNEGRIVEWVGSATDIDDRKRAEDHTREQAERLQAAMDASGTGTFRWEFATNTLIWDENLDRLFGLAPGRTARSLEQFIAMVHPDDRQCVIDRCVKCKQGGANFDKEFRVIHPDGSIHWLDDHGKAMPDATGESAYMTGACVDITARKKAEEEIRQSTARYRELAELTPMVLWTAGSDGQVDYYNHRWLEFTGVSLQETLGDGWKKICHPDDIRRAYLTWTESVQSGHSHSMHLRIRHHSGEYRWLHAMAEPVKDADGRVLRWYGTAVDVHDQRIAEEELRRARAEAIAANRAKDQFLAALSHELRTPLNPALLTLSSLLENPVLPGVLREEVSLAKRNIELETHLIDDLLDVTRITQGKLHVRREPVAIHDLLHHACNACVTGQTERRVNMVWKLHASKQHVSGDPSRLQQVFWNLLKNALKFTPDEGTITIATENPEPGRICISITDTGIGIARDAIKKIFAPFEQGTPTIGKVFGGLGLGLAIAKGVVELHQGTISAHSDGVGKGARFEIEFAVTDAVATLAAPRSQAAGGTTAAAKRILLVEDHEDTARTMMRILKIQGHAATAARTKGEALQFLGAAGFDAVITDLGLPDGSGRDLIRQIKREWPLLPVVALSGFGMPEDIEESLEAGAVAHLTKPIDLSRLRETLEKLDLNGG